MPENPTTPAEPVNDLRQAVTHTISVKSETQLLHEQRIETIKTEAKLRREHWQMLFTFFFLSAISTACFWVILKGGYSESTEKLGGAILLLIASGSVGYQFGKQSGKEEK